MVIMLRDKTHAVAGKLPNGIGIYDYDGKCLGVVLRLVWISIIMKLIPVRILRGIQKDQAVSYGVVVGVVRIMGLRTTDRNDFDPASKKFSDIGFRLAISK